MLIFLYKTQFDFVFWVTMFTALSGPTKLPLPLRRECAALPKLLACLALGAWFRDRLCTCAAVRRLGLPCLLPPTDPIRHCH